MVLASGEVVPAELIVWAAGIKAPDFLHEIDGLETDKINRLVVRPTLQTTRDDNIFAIGDCANCVLPGMTEPLPPRAQVAHQQANLMVKAIKARLRGAPLPQFKYRDFGSLVALAEYGTLGVLFHNVKTQGLLARLAYLSLHKRHLQALHGFVQGRARYAGQSVDPPHRAADQAALEPCTDQLCSAVSWCHASSRRRISAMALIST